MVKAWAGGRPERGVWRHGGHAEGRQRRELLRRAAQQHRRHEGGAWDLVTGNTEYLII